MCSLIPQILIEPLLYAEQAVSKLISYFHELGAEAFTRPTASAVLIADRLGLVAEGRSALEFGGSGGAVSRRPFSLHLLWLVATVNTHALK